MRSFFRFFAEHHKLAYGLGGTAVFMAPMALALGWGLLFATPLTLVLVPCLYAIGNDISKLGEPMTRLAKSPFRRQGK